jgi:hypothetical protein
MDLIRPFDSQTPAILSLRIVSDCWLEQVTSLLQNPPFLEHVMDIYSLFISVIRVTYRGERVLSAR